MIKRISAILGLILAVGGVIGLLYTLDCYVAKAADVALVAQRLEDKIEGDKADRLQERAWKLQDRYNNKAMPPLILEEHRQIIKELNELNIKMKKRP